MNFKGYKHVVIFTENYSKEKQAEGIAVNTAVLDGYCNKCGFLSVCSADTEFKPPVFAWCFQEKKRILESWKQEEEQ